MGSIISPSISHSKYKEIPGDRAFADIKELKVKIARKYNVPDKCPANCPYIEEYKRYNTGLPCRVCPVFLCKTLTYNGETINLVSPDSYPSERAKEWAEWFEGGMSGNIPGE